ncbi:hypothetical protein [Paenibacillus sp. R14(2021)]|uniref:hypothetical protein n=1 Tax=Paenibacillus sp. R14(2021) TaxID=2859228 RepID=UPI001C6134E1|nr:hypothetical protein [Paenibacillus sp. R14(2021)]
MPSQERESVASLDNVFKGTVSANSSAQQTVFSMAGLSSGSHTIKVIKGTGTTFTFDYF